MSVPAYNRTESELKVLKILDTLFKEIISVSKDNDLVSKKNRRLIINPMVENIRQAMYAVNNANNHNLNDEFERKLRKDFLMKAFEYLNNMIIDCKFCMCYSTVLYSVRYAKVLDLINSSKIALKSWIKSDNKRI